MSDPKRPPPEGGGRERPHRTASEETDRLVNMVAAMNASAAVIPIPGQSIALTGSDLLLIGAIVKVWDHPLSDGFLEGFWRFWLSRLAAGLGARVVGDALGVIPGIGTLVKSAAHAGATKLMGSSLRQFLERIHGKDTPAAITAEEGLETFKGALARIGAHTPALKEGVKKAVKGDTKPLAEVLRSIFAGR